MKSEGETVRTEPARAKPGYQERLYGGGLRGYVHNSRFRWVRDVCRSRGQDLSRVFELGCFDGRLLDFLPGEPDYYLGADAGWDGGLVQAQSRFRGVEGRDFVQATDASVLASVPSGTFSAAFALETLEHIPDAQVDAYLAEIARTLNGTFYITVPNEKGIIFLMKYLMKAAYYGDNYEYSARDVVNATLCRMSAIERFEHKGFDYMAFARKIDAYFNVESLHAIPLKFMPPFLAVTVGIVASSKA